MAKQKLTPEQISKKCSSSVSTSKSHERRVAKVLGEWSGVPFRRRRVTGREMALRIVEQVADVISCVGDFHFAIECKKGKGFSLDALMANPKGCKFTEWWHQSCYDAQLVSKDLKRTIYPLMFFKPEPNYDWVAVSAYAFSDYLRPKDASVVDAAYWRGDLKVWFPHLAFDAYQWLGQIDGDVSHSKKHPKIVPLYLDPVIMVRWRVFAESIDPRTAFHAFPTLEEITSVSGAEDA